MMNTIAAELRKLLTVRSTYMIAAIGLLLAALLAFFVEGWNGGASALMPDKLQNALLTVGGLVGVFTALLGILQIAHEYRYNTISYALTNTNSRSKLLLAKLVTIVVFSILLALVTLVVGVIAMFVGLALRDYSLAPQQVEWWSVMWRVLSVAIGFGITGLVLGLLFRNIVGAVVTLFLMPSMVEPLLSLWIKDNARFLPFTASDQIIVPARLNSLEALGIFSLWIAVGLVVAWILFYQRDAG